MDGLVVAVAVVQRVCRQLLVVMVVVVLVERDPLEMVLLV